MKAEKPKRIFKMPPCPAYDIAGMEAWLTEMAAQGYVLKRFFTNLIAVFEVQEPQKLRYALTSLSSNAFSVPDLDPSLEQLKAYCADFGWEYVDYRGTSCIFVTDDENAVDLHTDGDVEAMTLEQVRKEKKHSLVLPFMWTGIILFQLIQGGILLNIIQMNSIWVLLFLALLTISLTDTFVELHNLHKIQTAIRDGRNAKSKRNSTAYQARTLFVLLFVIALMAVTGVQYYEEKTGEDKIPLASYTKEIPTLMIEDLVAGDTYKQTDYSEYANTIIAKSDLLAPVYVSFSQRGAVYQDGICQFEGTIDVTYMETRAPWIAQTLAEDFQTRDESFWHKRVNRYKELELPELDVDYAAAWEHLLPAFVIADGNKVVYVYYYQSSGGDELTLEEITKMYADSLK